MAIRIEIPEGEDALTEFLLFHDRVYDSRAARWGAFLPLDLPMLMGEGPFAEGRKMRAFLARDGASILARAVALVDDHYVRHWGERLGHVRLFEAMPEGREATRLLMDAACEWLAGEGAVAARAGFAVLEGPFAIDDYESLPPLGLRQNPAYYHVFLKDAGFETERGLVDYKIEVRPELVARWQSALEGARRAGYEITPLREVPAARRIPDFTFTFNDSFKAHWGWTPWTEDELGLLLEMFAAVNILDTSVLAYRDGEPAGMVWVGGEISSTALVAPGRTLADREKLNFLGIGVRESARGRGVNLAMAAYAYLELVRRGAKWVSYTMVLDDNWPSRRTGEKLGASACANYVVYRRNFRR